MLQAQALGGGQKETVQMEYFYFFTREVTWVLQEHQVLLPVACAGAFHTVFDMGQARIGFAQAA
jgi:hypothetical protein